jgi:hypothetical protein
MLYQNTESRYRTTGREYVYGDYTAVRISDHVYIRLSDSPLVHVALVHGELEFNHGKALPFAIAPYTHDWLFTFFGI